MRTTVNRYLDSVTTGAMIGAIITGACIGAIIGGAIQIVAVLIRWLINL